MPGVALLLGKSQPSVNGPLFHIQSTQRGEKPQADFRATTQHIFSNPAKSIYLYGLHHSHPKSQKSNQGPSS